MDKRTAAKLKLLATKKMSAEISLDSQAKWYELYRLMPIFVFIVVFALFLLWGFIDSYSFDKVVAIEGSFTNDMKTVYGLFGYDSRFQVFSVWIGIGLVFGLVAWLFTRISVAVNVTRIESVRLLNINAEIEDVKASDNKKDVNPD